LTRRHNTKGRSRSEGRYLKLHHFMLETLAWRDLNAYARQAYVEIAMVYDGKNNGFLGMGVRRLAERLNVTEKTAQKAIHELLSHGFVEVAEESGFNRKDRKATEFRLTDLLCNRTMAAPSKAYQKWHPGVIEAANDAAAKPAPKPARRAA